MFRASLRRRLEPGAPHSRVALAGYRSVALLGVSVALAACSVVLDFGDDKQLVANAGAAGSAGSSSAGNSGSAGATGGGAGGSSGGTGGGGGSSAGAAGAPSDGGLCATDASPVGPDSGNQLFFYFDAKDQAGGTDDGDCKKDDARLVPLEGSVPADCDFHYGVNKEWIQLFHTESIACIGCLSPTPSLWVEFLLQYRTPVSGNGTIVFQPMRGAARAENATLAAVMLNDQHTLGLKCGDTEQYSQVTLSEGSILMLTYEYDFAGQAARLYVRGTSEGYAIGQLQEPNVEISCACSEPADGFFLRGIPGSGELLYDEFRAAENHGAIDDSY